MTAHIPIEAGKPVAVYAPAAEVALRGADDGKHMSIPARHFGLDWLRISAFILLIFYHIGMVFAPGDWLIKSERIVPGAAWVMMAIQPWRMPLLFAVSGYASAALLARTDGIPAFLKSRTIRLLLPLAFGMVIIVPPQFWVRMQESGSYSRDILTFWATHWMAFKPFHGTYMPEAEHLWFIAYLWTYTVALCGMVLFLPEPVRQRARAALHWCATDHRLLWAPLVPWLALRVILLFTVPEKHGLLHDWASDLSYFPVFLFGFALARHGELWPALRRCAKGAAVAGLLSGIVIVCIEIVTPDGLVHRGHALQALQRDMTLVMAWSMLLFLIGAADRWLNKDHPWRAGLSEAVFPFYIVHQTIIVLACWWLKPLGFTNAGLFAALAFATFTGCWLFTAVAKHSGPLRLMFGLNPPRRAGAKVQSGG